MIACILMVGHRRAVSRQHYLSSLFCYYVFYLRQLTLYIHILYHMV